ncbi:type I restriction endonuclease [Bacteroides ovatus]|uniref:Type I restriction endonuclease n=1 Tax=Bacteroides ovatus TaxID=28116 RepID=A0A6G0DH04_BACOV|nr:restriction endonuclease subunit S [Bacteroides sp.]KAA4216038.1 type I restriction endonuclease [Bacteroides ovatus]KAA4233220.1 type I restriction endonuclease [Bacteroides ovatus]KAA4272044.1 type I restriction endonuclease [Bacteroides ovatus]KAA4351374.1 type I restriction endonuclease [Bacteroides ovatus]KAA4360813.1 type I restriction endonuclease [Bacteroides ovatus]
MDTKKLRQKILDLAIRGKLVPQDPNDEPASVLLERIKEEKERLIKEGKIKRSKKTTSSDTYHYGNVPFEVPDNWVWTTLGEISNYGDSINVQVDRIKDNDWILELEDIEKDSANINQFLKKSERSISGVRHQFYTGEILYSKLRTYLNKVLVAPKEGYCTTELMSFNTYGVMSNKFVCHVLRSPYFLDYTLRCGYGVKMPRLSTADACKGMIPLPPLGEQQRIVAKIERWFSLIEQIEQVKNDLQTAIKQAKSKILDLAIHGKLVPQNPNDEPASKLLKRINPKAKITSDNEHYENLPNGWCYASIKEVFKINPRNKADDSSKAGFISMTNISDGYFNTFRYETRQWYEVKTGFTHFADGDIAVAKISPCLENRKSIILKDLPNGIGAGTTELYIFRSQCIDAKYGLFFFKSDYFINQCINSFNGVVGQQRVSKSIIEDIDIAIPPLEEQMRIANKVSLLFSTLDKIAEEL